MQQKSVFLAYSINNSSLSDYFVDLSNQFSESGYKVVVVSDKKGFQSLLHESVIVKFWPSRRPTKLKDLFFLLRLLNEYQPQIMISIFGAVNIFLLAGFIKRVPNRIAWVRTLSTQLHQKKTLRYRKALFYKLSTKVICNSLATKEDALKLYGIPQNKIQVLPNSVRKYSDVIEKANKNYNTILYVGRLHPTKGVDDLIRSFQFVKNKIDDSKLYIVGQGSYEQTLKIITIELGLQNDVIFLGQLSKQEVLKRFSSSGVAVVPSHSEAFGYTVIEAMSVKTCVIGANNTGIKEIIVHNETGLLFETKNSEDLAQKIISVIENRELCDKLAMKGYERFKEHYESKKAIVRDYNFFNKLIEC